MKHNCFLALVLVLICLCSVSCKDEPEGPAEPVDCTVEFYSKGIKVDTQTVRKGGLVQEFNADNEDDDYMFSGWYLEPSYDTKWNFETDHVEGDICLYAKWAEAISLYFYHGDDFVEKLVVPKGESAGRVPEAPEVYGEAFKGWFLDVSPYTEFDASWKAVDHCFFDARYEKIVPKLSCEAGFYSFKCNLEYGMVLTEEWLLDEACFDKEFVLDGWFSDKDFTAPFVFGQPILQDTIIHVKYHTLPTCVITACVDDRELGSKTVLKDSYVQQETFSNFANSIGSMREFQGWFLDKECSIPFDMSKPIEESFSIYAKYRGAAVKVGLRNLSSYVQEMDARYGELLPVPDPEDFFLDNDKEILGWYWDSGFTQSCDFEHDIITRTDHQIFARIGTRKYNVVFDLQGHGTAIPSVEYEHWDYIIPPESPTAEGYAFGGWYTTASCSLEWDFNTQQITGPLTLYAKWTPSV